MINKIKKIITIILDTIKINWILLIQFLKGL